MADWIIRFRFGGIESSLEYLETMAAKGWMLEYWQENTLLFRHAEPRKLRFTMDIIPIGMWKIDSDEHNAAIKADYLSMYEEMGWQYVENQGRKFIFCTEDETLPLPQTDPVAYEETIYEKHKSNMCRYLAACLIHLMMFAHIWRYQYMYLTSLRGVSLIGCFVCTLIFCGLGLINNGISVFREHRDLRNGIIPKYWGSEWFGRGMLVCFGAVEKCQKSWQPNGPSRLSVRSFCVVVFCWPVE